MTVDVVGFIFARGGSKGLPGKNIKILNGKPLIGWAIEHARAVPRIRRLIVSTDSEEVASVAKSFGAEVPFIRPENISTDDSPEWFAWQHALNYLSLDEGRLPDVMVSIPTTSPLRKPEDIEKCIDEYLKGEADIIITVTDAHRNPWFNMVKASSDGLVELVNKPNAKVFRRQDAPVIYDMTTVAYVANSSFVMEHNGHFSGRVRAVQIPLERAIDIDTITDFEFANFLMQQRDNL